MSSTAATLSSIDDASDSTRCTRLKRQLVHPLLKYDPRALDYIEVIGLEYFEADTTKVSSHAPPINYITKLISILGTCSEKSRITYSRKNGANWKVDTRRDESCVVLSISSGSQRCETQFNQKSICTTVKKTIPVHQNSRF